MDLGFDLLRHSSVTRYHDRSILLEDVQTLTEQGYACVTFDCQKWQSEADFHSDIATRFDFPDYYGNNLDALNDCLFGLRFGDHQGIVLIFHHWDSFTTSPGERAWHVLDILAIVSRVYLLHGKRFFALIHADNPEYRAHGLGAGSALLNRRESAKRAREAREKAFRRKEES